MFFIVIFIFVIARDPVIGDYSDYSHVSSFNAEGHPILRIQADLPGADSDTETEYILRTLDTSWLSGLKQDIRNLIDVHGFEGAKPHIKQVVEDAEKAHNVLLNVNGSNKDDKTRRFHRIIKDIPENHYRLGSPNYLIPPNRNLPLDRLRDRIKGYVAKFGYDAAKKLITAAVYDTEKMMDLQLHVKGDSIIYYLPINRADSDDNEDLYIEDPTVPKGTLRPTEPNWLSSFKNFVQDLHTSYPKEELVKYLKSGVLAKEYGVDLNKMDVKQISDFLTDLVARKMRLPVSRKTDIAQNWKSAFKSYVRLLATRHTKDEINSRLTPVIKVLQKKHNIKINDVDGEVHLKVKRKGKPSRAKKRTKKKKSKTLEENTDDEKSEEDLNKKRRIKKKKKKSAKRILTTTKKPSKKRKSRQQKVFRGITAMYSEPENRKQFDAPYVQYSYEIMSTTPASREVPEWYHGPTLVPTHATTVLPEPEWASDFRLLVRHLYEKNDIVKFHHIISDVIRSFETKYNVEIKDFNFDVDTQRPTYKVIHKHKMTDLFHIPEEKKK